MEEYLGVIEKKGIFHGNFIFVHLDCFYWVKRDAFLPQGSHGLKAVTKKKLGYIPIEVDPEDMVPLARNDPQKLCEYSVSDAVATYYLYIKHIHDFIFALCTIIPMNPDDVLRRGSGTLCEHLLMAQAYSNNIVFPNRNQKMEDRFYESHLIEKESYVGGYVECINNGIYRSDIPTEFQLDSTAYDRLSGMVKDSLEFFVIVEQGKEISDVNNLEEIKLQIQESLIKIKSQIQVNKGKPMIKLPLIYHIDVSSMYPNIILTNRLQPTAIVNNRICSNCLFNEAKNDCKRVMGWDWKVQYYPISQHEYQQIKFQNPYKELKPILKTYSKKNYKCQSKTIIEYKEDTVCMRENSFYVDTIRDFRDRRYKYKRLSKLNKQKSKECYQNQQFDEEAKHSMLGILYDSLQLAHKIILNSFYGYVMKKGARWYSMEMAAMVTNTGAKIIQESKKLMDKIGKPLELDTDGIWTLLPEGFPQDYKLKTKQGKTLNFSFPCSIMNYIIYDQFKNTQYQTLENEKTKTYSKRSEMSIFFEIDGPYKAMVIPASREKGKKLKKRYCVFNFKNQISEIKGFEIKRRGELGIVKEYQKKIFGQFLKGNDLKSLYQACAETSREWLRIITLKGQNMDDQKILDLLAARKVLSKPISEYHSRKNISITAALRISEFLGKQIIESSGLNCTLIVSQKPEGEPLSSRAIPIQVFSLSNDD